MKFKLENFKDFGTILGIWAHPDDETWTSAGIALSASTLGNKYVAIYATMGESGIQDESRWPADKLLGIRQKELEAALKDLRISDYRYLHYPDGDCESVPADDAVPKIAKIIKEVQPQTILTFGPDGLTGHHDHMAVSDWATKAIKAASLPYSPTVYWATESIEWYESVGWEFDKRFDLYFNKGNPKLVPAAKIDLLYELPPDQLEKKLAALKAHTSQTERFFVSVPPGMLQNMFGTEKFMRAQ
jgi:LmbE family N-acetylglucosaminyl deacetylase